MNDNEVLPGSPHFRIEKLADGVYAAIHKDGGGAICNAGIVDLGSRTLVFDTFLTPQAARDLKIAAESLTSKPVTIVVNSHCHNDHIWGNQVFSGQSDIVSTITTREAIINDGIKECEWYRENAPKRLASLQERYTSAADERVKGELSLWLDYYRQLAKAMPQIEVVAPNMTFSGSMMIHGSKRTAELIEHRNGHTRSDVVLFLPQDSVVFAGDLLFVNTHPYLGDGDSDALVKILLEMKNMDVNVYLPGHGPVGESNDLQVLVDYITGCRELVDSMIKQGQSEDSLDTIAVPKQYDKWQQEGFFRSNLHFLYKKMAGGT